jgi:hypothetical protein
MSTAERKLSGDRHPYLVRAEKKELDDRVLALHRALVKLTDGCRHVRLGGTDWAEAFARAEAFVTRLYKEMLNDDRHVDYKNRVDYVAGMKALDDGAKEMEAAKNRGDTFEKHDGTGGMAAVAEEYDWLHELVQKCKAKQTEYEQGWDAVRQFDADNDGTAMGVRSAGFFHAFKRTFRKRTADMDAMRGLLAEMGRCKPAGCV